MMRSFILLILFMVAGAISPRSCIGKDLGRALLFVDDGDILYRSGTQRVFQPATRCSDNPLIKSDKPWDGQIGWTSIYRNEETGKYQLWYQAYTGEFARERTKRCVVCYAESDDGIHFVKPELDLFSHNDSSKTNIVLIANGGTSDRYGCSVIVDVDDKDPGKRYKMIYFDFAIDEGKEYPGHCVAFSPDGVHWSKYPNAPVQRIAYGRYESPVPFSDEVDTRPWSIPLSMSDATDVFRDPLRNKYVLYGKMWIDGPAGGMFWKHAMGRAPLVTTLQPGTLTWRRSDGRTETRRIGAGLLEIAKNACTVLTDRLAEPGAAADAGARP